MLWSVRCPVTDVYVWPIYQQPPFLRSFSLDDPWLSILLNTRKCYAHTTLQRPKSQNTEKYQHRTRNALKRNISKQKCPIKLLISNIMLIAYIRWYYNHNLKCRINNLGWLNEMIYALRLVVGSILGENA